MKKAFTLSEALVTLAIIGVLAAILLPIIDSVRPDKDRVMYKKALSSLQNAISNAMDSGAASLIANSAAYWKDTTLPDEAFCEAVADSLNTVGSINCKKSDLPSGKSSYVNPNFITTDGVRYWGLEGKFDDNVDPDNPNGRIIYIDRAISEREIATLATKRSAQPGEDGVGLKINVGYDGQVTVPDTDKYEFESGLVEQSLQASEGRM